METKSEGYLKNYEITLRLVYIFHLTEGIPSTESVCAPCRNSDLEISIFGQYVQTQLATQMPTGGSPCCNLQIKSTMQKGTTIHANRRVAYV